MYLLHTCIKVEPSILETLGPDRTVLIIEVSSFHGLRMYVRTLAKNNESFGSSGMCPHSRGSAIRGSGLEGFHNMLL